MHTHTHSILFYTLLTSNDKRRADYKLTGWILDRIEMGLQHQHPGAISTTNVAMAALRCDHAHTAHSNTIANGF